MIAPLPDYMAPLRDRMEQVPGHAGKLYWKLGERFLCPCCHLPTLTFREGYDCCAVCWWEDDGQDAADAGEVRGGPNHRYSLTRARQNFRDHLDMYDTGQGIRVVREPSPARLSLLAHVRRLVQGEIPVDVGELENVMRACR
ncbi:CPCC family cysteine-rich protein [Halovulum marinum]|nr:CPCC family cysteine-rich protein [Halovulum marinum]